MSDDEIRIAIAEENGYSPDGDGKTWRTGPHTIFTLDELPDYPNDLNAIHEAALSLPLERRRGYAVQLRKIVLRDATDAMRDLDSGLVCDLFFYEATTHQRAEALLRTKGNERNMTK